MAIRPDTNTSSGPTKVDNDMSLAGNQRITGGISNLDPHLPYSPAEGFPLEDGAFSEGKDWTRVSGKIHPGTGPGNDSW